MQDYKTEKIDITPSWNFVAQGILAILDCNTNIKTEDRENIKGLLLDMSGVGDQMVDLMGQLTEMLGLEDSKGVSVPDIEREVTRLTTIERWTNQEMRSECEDNEVVQDVLTDSLDNFLERFGFEREVI
tara:strand:- start:89 stop:475 length:387 start_codon:yes stop_codon:yes gene_type:complete